MKKSISITLLISVFLILTTIIDVSVRYAEFANFSTKMWGIYIGALLFLFLLFKNILYFLGNTEKKWAFNVRLVSVCAIYIFLTVGSYGFYRYFSILPNVYTFEYMFDELYDFFSMMLTGIDLLSVIFFVILTTASFFAGRYFINKTNFVKRKRSQVIVSNIMLIILFFVLNNNIRLNPGASQPAANVLFSFTHATMNYFRGKETWILKLNQANRVKLDKIDKDLDFNILIILNESLRAANSGTHGYVHDTTPVQAKFLKENDGIIFSNFYAVSTRTILALPTFLTGINPVQPGSYIFKYPILPNYAKILNDVKTFVISSHSFNWGHFIKFVDDGSWDYMFYKENSGLAQDGRVAIKDKYTVKTFDKHISSLKDNFVGIVHFYSTHQPYLSREKYRKFDQDNQLGRYDNSVLTLDSHIGEIIESLKKADMLKNTVIIATADHAEALREHGYKGHHHTFYEEEALVPGWMYIPKELRENETLNNMYLNAVKNKDNNLSNIDILPTVLDLMGLWGDDSLKDLQKNFIGDPITGVIDPQRFVNFQNFNSISKAIMFEGLGLKYKDYKYLLHSKHGKLVEEVYDLKNDPKEKNNIARSIDSGLLALFRDELKSHKNSNTLLEQYLAQDD